MSRDRGECQLQLDVCTLVATEIDHVGDPYDDSDENLRAVCASCHRVRSGAQRDAASRASNAHRYARRHLPKPTKHPGDW